MNILRKKREQLGITQKYVAQALKIGSEVVSYHETKTSPAKNITYDRILYFLNNLIDKEGGGNMEEVKKHRECNFKEYIIRVITTKDDVYFAVKDILMALHYSSNNVARGPLYAEKTFKFTIYINVNKVGRKDCILYQKRKKVTFIPKGELIQRLLALTRNENFKNKNAFDLIPWIKNFQAEEVQGASIQESSVSLPTANVKDVEKTITQANVPPMSASLIVKELEDQYASAIKQNKELEASVRVYKESENMWIQQIEELRTTLAQYKFCEEERNAELKTKLNEYESKVLFADEILAIRKNLEL